MMNTTPYDRMFVYAWHDVDHSDETKFGERWVFADEDPEKEVYRRVRESQQVNRDRFDEGKIVIDAIWDVTDYAKKIGRYFKQSRVDDAIREAAQIGHRKDRTEKHTIPHELLQLKVNDFLKKEGSPLKPLFLTAWQARSVETVVHAFKSGHSKLLADLCARAGKTTFAGAVIFETKAPLTVIASYVLTSFTSFENDLSKFEQFRNFVLIEATDEDYKEQVKQSLSEGKQTIVFLSMCKGGKEVSKRDQRIKFLLNVAPALVIVDEADFGSWKPGQTEALSKHFNHDKDRLILMTGTNADRACGPWNIDSVHQVVYLEMLMEKKEPKAHYHSFLKNFVIDPSRHDLVVDVEFYQMGLPSLMEKLRKVEPDLFVEDGVYLPSWAKFIKDPLKAKGFFVGMLRAIFNADSDCDDLNLAYQTRKQLKNGVYMMFLPGNTLNKNLLIIKEIAESFLENFEVVLLSGANGVCNKKAEAKARDAVEKGRIKGRNVLILATCLAQRSFSIGEIDTIFLAYDNGQAGSTIQKMSRGLTPHTVGKVGRIVSLSFDPNRDDKLDALMLATATNYRKTHGMASVKDALAHVLKTINIFRTTEDGRVAITVDEYLETMMNLERIARVVGQQSDVSKIGEDLKQAILENTLNRYVPKTDVAEKGKIGKQPKKGGKRGKPVSKSDVKLLKEKIVAIIENLDVIINGTGTKNMREAFAILEGDADLASSVNEVYGMSWKAIKELVDSGAINLDLIDLKTF